METRNKNLVSMRKWEKKIIDAAIEEFKQKGLKFTMSDVAKRLSISKKTIKVSRHCSMQ